MEKDQPLSQEEILDNLKEMETYYKSEIARLSKLLEGMRLIILDKETEIIKLRRRVKSET